MTNLLCRIVWSTEYKSLVEQETFFPGNMKYPRRHKTAHELLNFANEKGYVYGFVEDNKSQIKLENLGAPADSEALAGITVIWCALDKPTRRLRVAGFASVDPGYRYGSLMPASASPSATSPPCAAPR
jgi:hypothetical protein